MSGQQAVVIRVKDREIVLDSVEEILQMEFTWDVLKDATVDWRIGGLTDPLGQLVAWLWEQISGAFEALENTVWGFLLTIKDRIVNALTPVIDAVKSFLSELISGVASALSSAYDFLKSAYDWVVSKLDAVTDVLSSIGSQLFNAISSGIQTIIGWITSGLNEIWGAVNGLISGFEKVTDFFKSIYNKLADGLSEVRLVLAGFVNPLTQIYNVFVGFYDRVKSFFSLVEEWLNWDAIVEKVTSFFTKTIPSTVVSFFTKTVPSAVSTFISIVDQYVIEPAKRVVTGFVNNMVTGFKGLIEKITTDVITNITDLMMLVTPPVEPTEIPVEPTQIMGKLIEPVFFFLAEGTALSIVADLLQTEVQIMGNKAKFDLRLLSNILSSFINPQAFLIPIYWAISQVTIAPLFQMLMNYKYRPKLPYPSEVIEWYWRGIITDKQAKWILRFSGYRDEFVDALIRSSEKVLSVTDIESVYYRATAYTGLSNATITMALPDRQIQLSLSAFKQYVADLTQKAGITEPAQWLAKQMRMQRYTEQGMYAQLLADLKMPSVNDLITFVVREIIKPEDFFVACQMQGLHPYWASAYWEAHWRLPSFENLREAFWRGIISADEFRKYVIWHDYRPFARPGISKSDVDIVMSLQWKLPTRIDTRWMAKYGLINWEQHLKLVQMEGYPNGDPYKLGFNIAETVAKAEIINVVVDERTLWRNRLFEHFESGYMTLDELKKTVEQGFSVKIGNLQLTVGFHPLEVALMLEATKLRKDRRLKDMVVDDLVDAYVSGGISFDKFKSELAGVVKDEDVRKAIISSASLKKLKKILSGIRSEAESAIDRWLYLYESGYATLDEIKKEIDKLVPKADISKEELECIFSQAKARRERWYRDKLYDHYRRLYQYGRLEEGKFKDLLKKFGTPDEIVDLEAEAYSWFTTRLYQYADDVVDLYVRGKLTWNDAVSLMKELGMSQSWINRMKKVAEVRRRIYILSQEGGG